MSNWKSFLKADPVDWLLEENEPSVRYFTLTGLLERPPEDPAVQEARAQIMNTGAVPHILSHQKEGGFWGIAPDFYIRAKYRGTVWNLIILAELGADGRDPRIRQACEFILNNSRDRLSGGFAYRGGAEGGGEHLDVIPCLTGNMTWSLLRFGCFEDKRVQQAINWITACQRFDDRIKQAPQGFPYDNHPRCWGTHTCHMGALKALKALAEIPPEKRSAAVKKTIANGAEYFLKHHIHKRSHNLAKIVKPQWLLFTFPTMYQFDILEVLEVLLKLGYRDERMQEAIDLVVSKQDEDGTWLLENTFNGRFLVNIERKDKPSKWITLKALRVLKGYCGSC